MSESHLNESGGKDYIDESFDADSTLVFAHSNFEGCDFVGVDLAETSLRRAVFQDCRFANCDLSRAQVHDASFRDCHFANCRMMAIDWSVLGGLIFGIQLTECKASFSIFDEKNLQWCRFSQTDLSESSLRDCDLSGLTFDGCNLARADFQGAKLIGADLSGATGVMLFPGRCQLRGTRVDLETAVATLAAQGIIVDG